MKHNLQKKKEFMYCLGGKYYIIGRSECKECKDEDSIELYRQYIKLTDDKEFRDFDVRRIQKCKRNEIAEAFKAVMKSCDDQVKQSQMTQEKHTFREKLEKNFGAELDKQIDQWLKAERCADFKDIATKANLTSFNP